MIEICFLKTTLRIGILFPATVLFVTVLDTDGMALACLTASVLHEAGHLLALALCKEWPKTMTINVFGVRLEKREGARLSHLQDVAVSLAGPAVNLVIGGAFWCFGDISTAVIHWAAGGFNLLPLEPLDGGQALESALHTRWSDDVVQHVMLAISIAVLVPMFWVALTVLNHSGYNFTFLAVTVYVAALLWLKRKS